MIESGHVKRVSTLPKGWHQFPLLIMIVQISQSPVFIFDLTNSWRCYGRARLLSVCLEGVGTFRGRLNTVDSRSEVWRRLCFLNLELLLRFLESKSCRESCVYLTGYWYGRSSEEGSGESSLLKLDKLQRVRQPDVCGKSDDGVRWSGEGSEG